MLNQRIFDSNRAQEHQASAWCLPSTWRGQAYVVFNKICTPISAHYFSTPIALMITYDTV